MSIRRMTPSSAQLTGGDLSVDILHTEDSVQVGDGTNLLGSFPLVGALRSLPVANAEFAKDATLTGGTQKVQIYDPGVADGGVAEVDLVGTERALKVSVISQVGGGGGGTAATDSAAFAATATQGTPIMGALDDVAPDALAEGEMGIARMTSARALHVELQNASVAVTGTFYQATQPVSGTFWQATQPVSGTVAVTGVATLAEQQTQSTALSAIQTAVQTIDNAILGTEMQVDVLTMPTVAVTGTFWQATQPVSGTFYQATQPVSIAAAVGVTDNGGTLSVDDGAGSLTVDGTVAATQSGTWNVGTLTSITNTVTVSGTVTASSTTGAAAHDAAISGNPVAIGARAGNVSPTAVANGDVTYIRSDLSGNQVTTMNGVRSQFGVQATTITASTAETTIVTAGGASNYNDLTSLTITNSSATALIVTLKDSTAGTTRGIFALAANGGITIPYIHPLTQSGSNANWTLTCGTSVSSIYVSAQYVTRVVGG